MRKALLALLLIASLLPQPFLGRRLAFGDFIQGSTTGVAGTAPQALAFTSNVTQHSILYVIVLLGDTIAGHVVTCTDTLMNTFAADGAFDTGFGGQSAHDFWVLDANAAGADTVTCSSTGSSTTMALTIAEFYTPAGASADGTVVGTGGTGTTADSTAITVSDSNPLLVGWAVIGTAGTFTAGSSFTDRSFIFAAPNSVGVIASRQPGASGMYSYTSTLSPSTQWVAILAGFKSNAAPPSGGTAPFVFIAKNQEKNRSVVRAHGE